MFCGDENASFKLGKLVSAFTINDKIVISPPAKSVMVEMIDEILAEK